MKKLDEYEINDIELKQILEELIYDFKLETEKERQVKIEWSEKLKHMIDVQSLFEWLNDYDNWYPENIVKIYDVDEKNADYNHYQHVRIEDDKENMLYMMIKNEEINDTDHHYICQKCVNDYYYGYLLFPLKNKNYFKVSFSC